MSDLFDCGSFEIWPTERQLRIDGAPVAVGARAFDVLLALVERCDRVATKDELLDAVWPDVEIEDNNLSVQISALRKLLGPAAIVTLPGRGYRLVLPATRVSGTPPLVVPSSTRPAVAVLPFDTHRAEDAYFGDGMTEEIITLLSANHGLFVIARNSSLRYRGSTSSPQQIATELGVRYLVYGSVRRLAKQLRIGAELVEAATGRNLWADHFEGTGEDLFEFQTRIAARLSAAIDARVEEAEIASAARRPTRNLSAYDCLLRALGVMHSFSDGGFERAGDLLRRSCRGARSNWMPATRWRCRWLGMSSPMSAGTSTPRWISLARRFRYTRGARWHGVEAPRHSLMVARQRRPCVASPLRCA